MWYKNVGTSFFHFVTMHAFDRQTDGRTYSQTDGQKGLGNTVRRITCSRVVKTVQQFQFIAEVSTYAKYCLTTANVLLQFSYRFVAQA